MFDRIFDLIFSDNLLSFKGIFYITIENQKKFNKFSFEYLSLKYKVNNYLFYDISNENGLKKKKNVFRYIELLKNKSFHSIINNY
jgi:hypothetical protein